MMRRVSFRCFVVPMAVVGMGAMAADCAAKPVQQIVYRCADNRTFTTIIRDDRSIQIVTATGSYIMARRPSSLGIKYSSEDGTLILDGDFAAFVLRNDIDFRDCTRRSDR